MTIKEMVWTLIHALEEFRSITKTDYYENTHESVSEVVGEIALDLPHLKGAAMGETARKLLKNGNYPDLLHQLMSVSTFLRSRGEKDPARGAAVQQVKEGLGGRKKHDGKGGGEAADQTSVRGSGSAMSAMRSSAARSDSGSNRIEQ